MKVEDKENGKSELDYVIIYNTRTTENIKVEGKRYSNNISLKYICFYRKIAKI